MLSVGHSATIRVDFTVRAMGTGDPGFFFFVNVNNGNCGLVMSPCGVCHVRMDSDAVRGELCNRPRGFQYSGGACTNTLIPCICLLI